MLFATEVADAWLSVAIFAGILPQEVDAPISGRETCSCCRALPDVPGSRQVAEKGFGEPRRLCLRGHLTGGVGSLLKRVQAWRMSIQNSQCEISDCAKPKEVLIN